MNDKTEDKLDFQRARGAITLSRYQSAHTYTSEKNNFLHAVYILSEQKKIKPFKILTPRVVYFACNQSPTCRLKPVVMGASENLNMMTETRVCNLLALSKFYVTLDIYYYYYYS